ncbi:MAG: transposase, partial [Solimicrobium sp.]|nr:transposase [Solimicrobium sp.]
AVIDEVKAWQSRPLDAVYPIVYMDCIHVKVRDSGAVRVKAIGVMPPNAILGRSLL